MSRKPPQMIVMRMTHFLPLDLPRLPPSQLPAPFSLFLLFPFNPPPQH